MQPTDDPRFDVASFLSQGARDYQEDAISTEFGERADFGIVVLADGMGGHAAGDVASGIVVEQVFGALKDASKDLASLSHNITSILTKAAETANAEVKSYVGENPEVRGMGATLLAGVILHNLLYWVSIGDSPLFLYREGELKQLNEDHSMAPQIDFLVKSGMMDPEVGRTHPDRSVLTSVIIGGDIEQIDCPKEPFRLEAGDLVLFSSDGIQYLDDAQITAVLASVEDDPSEDVANAIGAALVDLDDPEQDNASFAAIRYLGGAEGEEFYEVAWEEEAVPSHANNDEIVDPPLKASGGSP